MRKAVILSLATIVLGAFCAVGISSAAEKGEKGGEKLGIKLSAVHTEQNAGGELWGVAKHKMMEKTK